MKSSLLKKVIVLILILSGFLPLYSQELLDNQNASWSKVLPGTVVCQPVLTSYGFCLASDAKTVIALSSSGKLLWEKSFAKTKNVSLAALPSDFILFFDKDRSVMKLINPSGSIVWETSLPFNYTENSFLAGRDGRFFIKGNSCIICYAMNGLIRWKIENLKLKDLPPQELPDGSLVLFTGEKEGKSCGLRISPFGEILEEITFSGEISNARWCQDGVLLSFNDGSAGLFALKDGLAENQWVFNKKVKGLSFAVNSKKDKVSALLPMENSLSVNILNAKNGNISKSFTVKDIKGQNLLFTSMNDSSILLADDKNCMLFKSDGTPLRIMRFENQKSKSAWNYLAYTPDNYLLLCRKNWSLDAFRLHSSQSNSENSNFSKKLLTSYPDFIEVNTEKFNYYYGGFGNEMTDSANQVLLKDNNLGKKEIEITSNALSTGYAYSSSLVTSDFGTRMENSVFEEDSSGLEKILSQLPYLSSSDSAECIASIIRRTSNPSIINALLKGVSECPYDPEGKILAALEQKASKIDSKNVTNIESICNAVGGICQFMGKPAYFSKGRNILKNFLSPNQDARSREHVRTVMESLL